MAIEYVIGVYREKNSILQSDFWKLVNIYSDGGCFGFSNSQFNTESKEYIDLFIKTNKTLNLEDIQKEFEFLSISIISLKELPDERQLAFNFN